jgi:hypothetical protein
MSNTTPEPYEIWYPEASDPIAPLHSAFNTLADSVYDSFEEHVTPLSNRLQTANYSVDTVTDMNALTDVIPGSNAYVIATKARYSYDGTTWTPNYIPWTDYEPTAITGLTFNTARYMVTNNIANVNIKATKGTTASTFQSLNISLPITSSAIVDDSLPIGNGVFRKGGSYYPLVITHQSVSSARAFYLVSSPTKMGNIDGRSSVSNEPAKVENGNYFLLNFSYPLT